MRLEGQKAMGYYPTPESLIPVLRSYVQFPEGSVAVLDPFAGEGKALTEFVRGTEATTYGIELDNHRAEQAKTRLDRVAVGAMEGAKVSHGSVGLLYFNPPYDWGATKSAEEKAERKEAFYIARCHPYLRTGGILVALVPQSRLGSMARTLATQFSHLMVRRFPDDEYKAYKQVAVFGVKRDKPQRDAVAEAELLAVTKLEPEKIPQLESQSSATFTVPNTLARIPMFLSALFLSDEADGIERVSAVWAEMGGWLTPLQTELTESPPLPLHTGHQASLLASGALNGVLGVGEERHLVKGLVNKVVRVEEAEEEDREGNVVTVTREIETYAIKIAAVTADGKIVQLS